ncbi:sensor domain-containing diguanylate cyclase [Mycobacterium yunnanensis]|uniref:Sensor domain-containing diguanylate cyclase n=1 Tax=Mycobacterium yunnanensis TaxID=368477 RepID=A0A9X2Z1E8_9MYCO|nr:sensor domain-containing diguanylate cyclase [Mycobacterium yunnanensis]
MLRGRQSKHTESGGNIRYPRGRRKGVWVPDWALQRRRALKALPTAGREPRGGPSDFELDVADAPVLRALLRISRAVLRADYFDEALEVIAEQAQLALDAASVSISRWEPETHVRTLINVGTLGLGEQRWPEAEIYDVRDDGPVIRLLRHGQPYTFSVDEADANPTEAQWLQRLGKESELAVPIMHDDAMWGELWATGVDGRRFGADDVQLLQAIAAHAAVAIGRSELFSTVWRFAHQDPLTGLANRRELDRQFSEIDWQSTPVALLVGDLDGFKTVNDRDGHPAGDALLRDVGAVLGEVTSSEDDATAVRLGGDEFCVLLPNRTLEAAERLASETSHRVRRILGTDVTLSWGATLSGPHTGSGQDLLAAADAALLDAKRLGPGRYNVGVDRPVVNGPHRRTGGTEGARSAIDLLVPRVLAILDEHAPLDLVAALEVLAMQVHNAVDAAAWALSETASEPGYIRTIRGVDSMLDEYSGLSKLRRIDAGTVYRLADYPWTDQVLALPGTAFIADVGREDCDAAEAALLETLGYHAVLAVGVRGADRQLLLEIFARPGHELDAVAPYVRVLANHIGSTAV